MLKCKIERCVFGSSLTGDAEVEFKGAETETKDGPGCAGDAGGTAAEGDTEGTGDDGAEDVGGTTDVGGVGDLGQVLDSGSLCMQLTICTFIIPKYMHSPFPDV